MSRKLADQTQAIHAGKDVSIEARTVSPAVQRGSTVLMPNAAALYDSGRITYGRAGLQPQASLIAALCELEHATSAVLYPSGLAAMTGAILGLISAGDDILVADCVYAPTRRFCDRVLKRLGVSVRYFDPAISPADLTALFANDTRLLVMESPGSLSFEIQDIAAVTALARDRGVTTLMDNTWAAGLLFRPLDHGVDISIQALTKYVGGHSDAFMGAAATGDIDLARKLDESIWHMGWSASPDDAWLMLRGLRTLPTRLARHGQSALEIAAWLGDQPGVAEVICPGLPGSRGHVLWKAQFSGHNGLVGVVLTSPAEAAAHAFLDALELFGLGFSWGGYESLAVNADPQFGVRKYPPSFAGQLIRLHVGLEDVEDLKADLTRALAAALKA